MAIALMAMACAILHSACGGGDIGRMLYNGLAQACDNKEPDDQSCGF